MMNLIAVVVTLLAAVTGLVLLSRKLHLPYPILLVVGGSLFGLIPGLPPVRLEPQLIFLCFLPRLLFPGLRARDPYPSWRHVAIVAWTGMRGVVSLAAAMALPLALPNGAPFPGRNLILFLTFVVILVTLVLQGLSLPAIIRGLKIQDDRAAEREERIARLKANEAALARLDELAVSGPSNGDSLHRLRSEYEDRIRQLEVCDPRASGLAARLVLVRLRKPVAGSAPGRA